MSSEAPERRLAAILSADVAGYSRLMAEDEDATVRTLRAWRTQVGELITEHRGRLADFTGDNFLAEFPAARDAVECALEIQRVVAARNAALPEARRMRFRIGAHLGDVRHEDARLFGDGVNVAARLQPLAEPGGLCLSAMIVEAVRGQIALELEDIGEQALKNLPNPVHAFRVRVAAEAHESAKAAARPSSKRRALALGSAALITVGSLSAALVYRERLAARLAPASVSALTPIRSIAVLPLANLSGDPEQEYYADGMTETLIAELAKLPGVRVISRTSVMQFKRTSTPLPEIAKQLNVDGVIEGSVMRAGDEVRITAQLVDARSDQHVWAEQYDRDLTRVLEIQSEVAKAVAAQIALALTPQQAARLRAPKPVDPRAQEAYFRSLGFQAFELTLGALSEATAIDPEFARAHAALAKTYSTVAIYQPTLVPDAASKARESALRAISLDDSLADSHEALGRIAFYFDWDWATAERELRRALELAHGISTARADLADLLLATGRRSEAFEQSRLFVEESQGESRARSQHALLLKLAGDYEGAIAEAEAALARDPRNINAGFRIAEANVLLGRTAESINAARRILEIPGDGFRKASAAESERALRAGGIDAHWRYLRDEAIRAARPVPEAEARAQLGEIDEAIAALERGYRERNPQMRHLISRHGLSPLHSDPRFADLARRMNLPLPKP